jgi:hypothetical protein
MFVFVTLSVVVLLVTRKHIPRLSIDIVLEFNKTHCCLLVILNIKHRRQPGRCVFKRHVRKVEIQRS